MFDCLDVLPCQATTPHENQQGGIIFCAALDVKGLDRILTRILPIAYAIQDSIAYSLWGCLHIISELTEFPDSFSYFQGVRRVCKHVTRPGSGDDTRLDKQIVRASPVKPGIHAARPCKYSRNCFTVHFATRKSDGALLRKRGEKI